MTRKRKHSRTYQAAIDLEVKKRKQARASAAKRHAKRHDPYDDTTT